MLYKSEHSHPIVPVWVNTESRGNAANAALERCVAERWKLQLNIDKSFWGICTGCVKHLMALFAPILSVVGGTGRHMLAHLRKNADPPPWYLRIQRRHNPKTANKTLLVHQHHNKPTCSTYLSHLFLLQTTGPNKIRQAGFRVSFRVWRWTGRTLGFFLRPALLYL